MLTLAAGCLQNLRTPSGPDEHRLPTAEGCFAMRGRQPRLRTSARTFLRADSQGSERLQLRELHSPARDPGPRRRTRLGDTARQDRRPNLDAKVVKVVVPGNSPTMSRRPRSLLLAKRSDDAVALGFVDELEKDRAISHAIPRRIPTLCGSRPVHALLTHPPGLLHRARRAPTVARASQLGRVPAWMNEVPSRRAAALAFTAPAPWPLPPHPPPRTRRHPVQPANARAKLFSLRKPTAAAICLIGRRLRSTSSVARGAGPRPELLQRAALVGSWRCSVRTDTFSAAATGSIGRTRCVGVQRLAQ